jgi:hypothetical protein
VAKPWGPPPPGSFAFFLPAVVAGVSSAAGASAAAPPEIYGPRCRSMLAGRGEANGNTLPTAFDSTVANLRELRGKLDGGEGLA